MVGQREDPPTLIIHLSDTRWCVFFFFSFLSSLRRYKYPPLSSPPSSFHARFRKGKFDRDLESWNSSCERENVLQRRRGGWPLRKLSSSTNRFTFGEKSCGKTRRGGGSKSKRWRESHYLGGYFVRVSPRERRATPADRPIRLQRERERYVYIYVKGEGERRIVPRVRYSPRNGCCTRPRIRPDKT